MPSCPPFLAISRHQGSGLSRVRRSVELNGSFARLCRDRCAKPRPRRLSQMAKSSRFSARVRRFLVLFSPVCRYWYQRFRLSGRAEYPQEDCMKTRLALLVGFAVAMGGGQILSAATAYAPVAVPKSNTKKLYVHVMPWFETKASSGNNT